MKKTSFFFDFFLIYGVSGTFPDMKKDEKPRKYQTKYNKKKHVIEKR